MSEPNDLTADEMREILTDIARTATNAAARIAAIKELRALDGADDDSNDDAPTAPDERAGDLALLDELAPRRYRAKQA